MSLLAFISMDLVCVEFQFSVDGPGISSVGGIICSQASQPCCDKIQVSTAATLSLQKGPVSSMDSKTTPGEYQGIGYGGNPVFWILVCLQGSWMIIVAFLSCIGVSASLVWMHSAI